MKWFGKSGAKPESQSDGEYLAWGGELHPKRLGPHFAVMGQNGSGKTLLIRMLMKTALAPEGRLLHRALIFDPKLDTYPVLRSLGIPDEQIHVLNPFDKRSTPWDIAADAHKRSTVEQFATTFLPAEGKSDNPYFTNAPRELLSELMDTLRQKAPGRWTLNDLVQIVINGHLEDVLSRGSRSAQATLSEHITDNAPPTAGNLRSSLRVGMRRYQTVAALWARSTKKPLSLLRWMAADSPPSILLLGLLPEADASLKYINRAVFIRVTELLLSKPEYPPDQTWAFFDELRFASELEKLPAALLGSRSKGGRFVLGFQDIHGLREVYKEHLTEELIAQCHNIAIFRLSSPKSMEWASDYFGKFEWWAPSYGQSDGSSGGASSSHNVSLQERKHILSSAFRELRLPTRERGMEGVFGSPTDSVWKAQLDPAFIRKYLPEPSGDPGCDHRDVADEEPAPFSAGLAEALGVDFERGGEQRAPEPEGGGFTPSLPSPPSTKQPSLPFSLPPQRPQSSDDDGGTLEHGR